jgi:hypothetical protein
MPPIRTRQDSFVILAIILFKATAAAVICMPHVVGIYPLGSGFKEHEFKKIKTEASVLKKSVEYLHGSHYKGGVV